MGEHRNEKIDFIASDNRVDKVLDKYKQNSKVYTKVLEALQILGSFNDKIVIDLYEIKEENNDYTINVWCCDESSNIFIFTLFSTLNNRDTSPTFQSYIDIFYNIIKQKNLNFNQVYIYAYKDFEKIAVLNINNKDGMSNIKRKTL